MTKNEILSNVFHATAKLELMKTLLETMIDMADDLNGLSMENAAAICNSASKIRDLIHIVFDGVYDSLEILGKVNSVREEAEA